MLCKPFAKVPRFLWNTVGIVVVIVCAIAGRDNLLSIFLNFLGLIGYWTIIWIAMTLEEEFIFKKGTGFDWSLWDSKASLPIGYAATFAFLVGWAGAIVSIQLLKLFPPTYMHSTARNVPDILHRGYRPHGGWVWRRRKYQSSSPIQSFADFLQLGLPLAMSWAAIVYPVARYFELKFVGR
jgi:hypothetical protein